MPSGGVESVAAIGGEEGSKVYYTTAGLLLALFR
jgi:hypothetical protein